MQAMEISRSALDVEWFRLEVIAGNLANANTVTTGLGGSYRAQRLISGPRGDFASHIGGGGGNGHRVTDRMGVMVYGIEPTAAAPRIVHEPANPQADANGNVAYPNIDHAAEMTLMVKTARAYEANIVMMNTARQMYSKALELGRRA